MEVNKSIFSPYIFIPSSAPGAKFKFILLNVHIHFLFSSSIFFLNSLSLFFIIFH